MSTDVPDRAKQLLNSRYLVQAKNAEAEAHVNRDLGNKLAHLRGDSEIIRRLRQLGAQAAQLWQERGRLTPRQLLYLTAGLLYFISPVDAVTDLIPVLGYIDDVAVLGWILAQIAPAVGKLKSQTPDVRDETIDQITEQPVDDNTAASDTVMEEHADESQTVLDAAGEDMAQKYFGAALIGLWGISTLAALTLAISMLAGGHTRASMPYLGLTSLLILGWNLSSGLGFWRRYRRMDAAWQRSAPTLVGGKLGHWPHLLAVGLPVLAVASLLVIHLLRA